MNKKEIAEIHKQFSPDRSPITRICGCYVDGHKNKLSCTKDAFMTLPEEETYKYLNIFKKTLSGKINNNLLNMEYTLEQELKEECHAQLLKLRESSLMDDEILDKFYDRVIENYDSQEAYYIVLVYGVYDTFADSEDEYEFILCSICPAKLSKDGLIYDNSKKCVESRKCELMIDAPMHGFLFPAFNDRKSDIHGCLYCCKKNDGMQENFVKNVLGCDMEVSLDEQRETFKGLIEEITGNSRTMSDILTIYQTLEETINSYESAGEPLLMNKQNMKELLEDSLGEKLCEESFEKAWDSYLGKDGFIPAENISKGKTIVINCGDSEIKTISLVSGAIRMGRIDDIPYVMIPTDGTLEVNGIIVDAKGECNT